MSTVLAPQTLTSAPQSWARRSWQLFSRTLVNQPQLGAYFEPLIQALLPQWTTDGYRAAVVAVRDENSGVFTLVLRPSRSWQGFKPGQFVEISVEREGVRTTRCFSISSTLQQFQHEGTLELSIRVQEQGRVTPWLRQTLKTGDFVSLSAAKGDFVIRDASKPLLFIAGGSGITPFRSAIGSLAAAGQITDAKLLYFCNGSTHLFRQEWAQLAEAYSALSVHFLDTLTEGLFCPEHLQRYCPDFSRRDSYICGPAPMIQLAREVLAGEGVPNSQIFFEYFGPAPVKLSGLESGVVSFSRSERSVATQADDSRSLLALAEESGLRPTAGCRMGVCHQCICQKESGVVYNTLTQRYSDTGREEIQLCVSVAAGNVTLEL